ncbi:hypothetical protein GLAREA_10105 [Glarea lozoyensis ATCC 20868]|uniref:DUF7580 domain-containing protein n=1 Tax=Glarea lozoyensis (strain ATCC 20868 / MF5171) TaxID=1116229 RepID=S3DQW3_GLAL2|nr:uncharacterized protein GLAREA_10105 [Glarea lozoyensis ATCC 20868]EPE34411.1 hypothetical protein GLAREA_10105 [Glarea lozoyensis ATCC 20868]
MTFEQYKKGSRYFSHWIQFRRKYESFIRDMEGQQLFFEGILQDLLCGGPNPYLIGGDSKDSFLDIVGDKDFIGWRDPVLKQRLVTRLDSRYDWCMYTIKRIYDIMTELGELLDIQALNPSNQSNHQWLSYELKRITQVLFDDHYKGHEESKRLIEELKQMVVLSDRQSVRGGFRSKTASSGLGPFFQKTRENANNLHELLKSSWHCCCEVSHKVLIQLERRVDHGDDNFNLLCYLPETKEKMDDKNFANYLQHSVKVKISQQIDTPKIPVTPKSVEANLKPPVVSPKASSETGISIGSQSSNKKDSSLRERVWDVRSSLKNRFTKKSKTKQEKTKVMKHFAIAEHMQVQDRLDVAGVKAIEEVTVSIDNPPPIPIIVEPLTDLCETISCRTISPNTILGCMVDESMNSYEFQLHSRVSPAEENRTLAQILEANAVQPYQFPPEKRAVVAAILASTILQLQKTSWLSVRLDKNDIFFTARDGKVLFDEPYLSQSFLSTTRLKPTPSTPLTTASTKLLLESLGIILIELCFGVPIETFASKTPLRPVSSTYRHEYHLAIAHAWTWEEIRAQDSLFSDPVQSCLHFPRSGLGRSDEVEDIYRLIAEPIYREMVRRWPERR